MTHGTPSPPGWHKARRAAERLLKTEQALERAKADYHRAIRQLHITGATLREIAAALNLSFQRVHQIIDQSGGGWRRWWRRGDTHRETACSFCGTTRPRATGLVHGPDVAICHRCVELAHETQQNGTPANGRRARFEPVARDSRLRCSFCGRDSRGERYLVTCATAEAQICGDCLGMCQKILKGRDE